MAIALARDRGVSGKYQLARSYSTEGRVIAKIKGRKWQVASLTVSGGSGVGAVAGERSMFSIDF